MFSGPWLKQVAAEANDAFTVYIVDIPAFVQHGPTG